MLKIKIIFVTKIDMSAFENYIKDDIVASIKIFIMEKKQQQPNIQINELIKETMEAVNYGLEHAIWEIENPS
jgi:hypothetical protein